MESQIARLEKQEADNDKTFARWKIAEIKAWERGLKLREVARRELPKDEWECFEYRFLRIFGFRRWQDCGHYLCDWWWCSMRDMDVNWCWDNCPNSYLHTENWHREHGGRCPTCHKPLAPPDPKPAGLVQSNLL